MNRRGFFGAIAAVLAVAVVRIRGCDHRLIEQPGLSGLRWCACGRYGSITVTEYVGGGGSAYARKYYDVQPGQSFVYTVGAT